MARLPFEALGAVDREHLHGVLLTHLAKFAVRAATHSTTHSAVHTAAVHPARRRASPDAGGTGAVRAATLVQRFEVREEESERAATLAQAQQLGGGGGTLLRA